ncbi:MAG: DUF1611 domain-containing protein [Planctomycetes bacterium]|nr:DUF1611 domain-containing protein [Planctomycetota bacterium]
MPVPTRVFKRLGVLIEGSQDIYRNKTAMALLRFRPEDVVCVIDSTLAGCASAGEDLDHPIPVVATMAEAIALGIEWLVIGVATPGGFLPDDLRPPVYEAIRNRVGVISGLHESVGNDPNLVALAARHAVELVNLRKPPEYDRVTATGKARGTRARRVMTVGTDANIGKTTTALALVRHLQGMKGAPRTRFVSTSQDGILVTGRGIAIDRVPADFAAGWTERLVLEEDRLGAGLLVVEGQNSILSPYSGGTALSLLHGACPDAMVLCHNPSRRTLRHTDVPVPPLGDYITMYERLLAPLHPGRVVAVSLNTCELDERAAADAVKAAAKATGLPCADPVRGGEAACRILAEALLAACASPAAKPAKALAARSRR